MYRNRVDIGDNTTTEATNEGSAEDDSAQSQKQKQREDPEA
jgi:hypothetical protein